MNKYLLLFLIYITTEFNQASKRLLLPQRELDERFGIILKPALATDKQQIQDQMGKIEVLNKSGRLCETKIIVVDEDKVNDIKTHDDIQNAMGIYSGVIYSDSSLVMEFDASARVRGRTALILCAKTRGKHWSKIATVVPEPISESPRVRIIAGDHVKESTNGISNSS